MCAQDGRWITSPACMRRVLYVTHQWQAGMVEDDDLAIANELQY
jgi:hypothetical protein